MLVKKRSKVFFISFKRFKTGFESEKLSITIHYHKNYSETAAEFASAYSMPVTGLSQNSVCSEFSVYLFAPLKLQILKLSLNI